MPGRAETITARITSGFTLAFGVTITAVLRTSPVELIVLAQALTVLARRSSPC